MGTRLWLLPISILLAMTVPSSLAYAYIDPGTGSYLFQLLLGSAMAAGVLVKVYWESVKNFFGRGRSSVSDDENDV